MKKEGKKREMEKEKEMEMEKKIQDILTLSTRYINTFCNIC